jgi:hypothetical protein
MKIMPASMKQSDDTGKPDRRDPKARSAIFQQRGRHPAGFSRPLPAVFIAKQHNYPAQFLHIRNPAF